MKAERVTTWGRSDDILRSWVRDDYPGEDRWVRTTYNRTRVIALIQKKADDHYVAGLQVFPTLHDAKEYADWCLMSSSWRLMWSWDDT